MKDKKLGRLSATLGIGPMSSEIIEATFRYSHYNRKELMLISSKNQIDHEGGYVNGWTTKEYANYIAQLKDTYNNSRVKVCRDHCGPGFNGIYDLEDSYKTIKSDIENDFDLIHIDFCHFKGRKEKQLEETKKAIEYTLKLKPRILIEIGTDENVGSNYNLPNLSEIERELDYLKSFCNPEFYVVQTGSVIKEINQAGNFNKKFVTRIAELLHAKDVKLKEHNADYLTKDEIDMRKGIVDAENIAPQLGVIQTQLILTKALVYGVPLDPFIETVYKGKKWKKWMYKNKPENKMLCVMIAGHYHFTSPAYKKIVDELAKREDIKETIINEMMNVINHYVGA